MDNYSQKFRIINTFNYIIINEIRYLGVYISKFKHFKCSLDYAKRSFYRATNAIFGKIGRIASEEVTLELV